MSSGIKVAVYCENNIKHRNTVWGQYAEVPLLKKVVNVSTCDIERVNFHNVKSLEVPYSV
jgi:hypothetical protein